MSEFDEKAKAILESFKTVTESIQSLRQVKRVFYPRNFQLSPEFIKAFKAEKARLIAKGVPEKELHGKITRALLFHA